MNQAQTYRALKRMLSNGPLAGVPKRPADQQLLVELAALQFDREKAYTEPEVNKILKAWLETFCEPAGIDHVTLRRMLVDSRLLSRTRSGSSYRVDPQRAAAFEEPERLDPARVLADIRSERTTRKRRHPN